MTAASGGGGAGPQPATAGNSSSPANSRPSLWKRLGRRGSKSEGGGSVGSGTMSSNHRRQQDVIPVESDDGNARSLAAKREQRAAASSRGGGGGSNNSRHRGRSRDSRGSTPTANSTIFGKIRNSVRGRNGSNVSANRDSKNSRNNPTGASSNESSGSGSIVINSNNNNSSALPGLSLNSPAYSTDSYQTIESDLEEKKDADDWNDVVVERQKQEYIYRKQQYKERDGFCRRVDTYDGQVIVVDQKATYEIGNYLGGGVAGVVYEGHRLRPMEEYPVRTGNAEQDKRTAAAAEQKNKQLSSSPPPPDDDDDDDGGVVGGFFCGISATDNACGADQQQIKAGNVEHAKPQLQQTSIGGVSKPPLLEEMAIEATMSYDEKGGVMLDAQDAPSRSQHYTNAAAVSLKQRARDKKPLIPGLPDETVAIKILNPVGYRLLQADGLKDCVIVKKGDPMDNDVKRGLKPMEERHVWWLVNPNSRNLRTLQRYNGKDESSSAVPRGLQIDRGSEKKGLRLSLTACYVDPRTGDLRELTLTRCIEIWGHVPFNATDVEFEDMLAAIERVNAGHPPPPVAVFDDDVPGRIGTDETNPSRSSDPNKGLPFTPLEFAKNRTGLMRAAVSERVTVHCSALNAYIAIPAVPTKYLRWLRQRRAATKEIRNMMLIGRHKNVLHLFEVLEYIQDSKSTMFLVLELVKGGELFDLISSSAGKGARSAKDLEQAELTMRRFFFELSSGIHYCHSSGIAHRDLKPENLLVHNAGPASEGTLKIADFGLSAEFGPSVNQRSGNDMMMIDSSAMHQNNVDDDRSFGLRDNNLSPTSQSSLPSVKGSVDRVIASGVSALSFLTCGAMENVLCIPNGTAEGASPLRRMTSVVGSPHYVAPEIISQADEQSGEKKKGYGYDGSKADVWSAGVILYAMLFRSLPFGEDLLRCPRYQSYRKWYDEVRRLNGRRSSAKAALNPHISDADERDFLGPHWFFPATTSVESRDLIVAMLNPLPEDRLTISQVLQHSWLQPEKDSIVADT